MNSYSFLAPKEIQIGPGKSKLVADRMHQLPPGRILVVTGSSPARHQDLLESWRATGHEITILTQSGEPLIADAIAAASLGKQQQVHRVIAIGGGSVIDLAKAAAALIANPGEPLDYLEVVGKGLPLPFPALPCWALPTTSGTGAEVTKNAVLGVPSASVKVSLRHDSMIPELAIIDPLLCLGLGARQSYAAGMDAFVQVLEPYLSHQSNAISDALCVQAIPKAYRALLKLSENLDDIESRSELAEVSLFGGLALANAKLGAVHGFAGPLGGIIPAKHGELCAALLSECARANILGLRQRDPQNRALLRYAQVACWLSGSSDSQAEDCIALFRGLHTKLKLPSLKDLGFEPKHLELSLEMSAQSSSMKGNPIQLTRDEMSSVLNNS